jgi:hypothetical protein
VETKLEQNRRHLFPIGGSTSLKESKFPCNTNDTLREHVRKNKFTSAAEVSLPFVIWENSVNKKNAPGLFLAAAGLHILRREA